jgi:tetratricopeptide (TPR) repeat protein
MGTWTMMRRIVPAVSLVLLAAGVLWAEDEISVKGKDKPIKGKITGETSKEVKVGLKDIVPAENIIDIVYDNDFEKISVKTSYKAAVQLERESLDPAKEDKRKSFLAEALKKYEELMPLLTTEKYAKRHVEYKIAMLRVRQAMEDNEPAEKAIVKLKDFTKKHPGGWQITSAYQTLGRLQVDAGKFEDAEDTYAKMAQLQGLPEETRLDARMLAIQAKLQGGKYDDARADIKELEKEMPKGSRFHARARVAEAECLVAETKKFPKEDARRVKLFDDAVQLVKNVINESNDKVVKAVGHNTLGYCYLEQGNPKDAMWEFLWVDVVYNQDRIQHAKALYHLWDLFTKDGDAPRAQECREALMAPQFVGLEYQKMVQKESKGQ